MTKRITDRTQQRKICWSKKQICTNYTGWPKKSKPLSRIIIKSY